ncbi:hypothetical protein Sme01_37460 [Sphaerisporangium melleum]|uniref:Uncharacterized protein n=1 Tax=Sphaerisporangium melleum TaxID=321316 RepID=A0A917RBN3_9ACTN|nr:hypothetical protein GCM10007964_47630 [Sphaerisporangium melleum]GII71270.1 hypothetical protein Sme01_37460 [Sphaerisporangium melleum]
MPASVARHKVRDIRSAHRHTPVHESAPMHESRPEAVVVHLQAYTGRNVIRFPRPGGGTPAA